MSYMLMSHWFYIDNDQYKTIDNTRYADMSLERLCSLTVSEQIVLYLKKHNGSIGYNLLEDRLVYLRDHSLKYRFNRINFLKRDLILVEAELADPDATEYKLKYGHLYPKGIFASEFVENIAMVFDDSVSREILDVKVLV